MGMQDKHDTPPAAPVRPGANPGYAETQPRDRRDAHEHPTGKQLNPEAGGLNRDTAAEGDPAQQN